jgi:hypothetical protein
MASTISINFATEQEVYFEYPPEKKSVSAKLLSDVLGGGVVSGGYLRKTGDSMTGYLTLTSRPPQDKYHAVTKQYVDDHSYTRRYYYLCGNNSNPGYVKPGTTVLSGFDIYTNLLKFFDKGDQSLNNIVKYMDVYRDGILQVYGSNQDYTIVNTTTFMGGTTAIKFNQPFQEGATFQVSIGNVGAFPTTFGVWNVYGSETSGPFGGYGVRTSATSGDVTLFVTPTTFAATELEVKTATRHDSFVTPRSLSAFNLVTKGWGLFRKNPGYDRTASGNPNDPYGSVTGTFLPAVSSNIHFIRNIGAFETPTAVNKFRVYLKKGSVPTEDYVTQVTANTNDSYNPEDAVLINVVGTSRTLTGFDFFVYDMFTANPVDIYEFSVTVS